MAYCAFFCGEIDAHNECFYYNRGKVDEEEEAQVECFVEGRGTRSN